MAPTVASPPTRAVERGRRRSTPLRDELNKRQGGVRKLRLKEFLDEKKRKREMQGSAAIAKPTEREVAMREFFRIKPENFDADAEAKWQQLWDETERAARESGDDAEFSVLRQLCTREGGFRYYAEMDPYVDDDELCMRAFVNVAYLLYLSDPDNLKQEWAEVEQIYVSRKELAAGALMAVEAGVDCNEVEVMQTGVNGRTQPVDVLGGSDIPQWGEKGKMGAIVTSCGLCIKSMVIAAAGSKVGTVTATALNALLVSNGVPPAVGMAITAFVTGAATKLTTEYGSKLIDVMTNSAAGLLSVAIDASVYASGQLTASNQVAYETAYAQAADGSGGTFAQIENMAKWVTNEKNVGKALATENYRKVYPSGLMGRTNAKQTMALFKKHHFEITMETRGGPNPNIISPKAVEERTADMLYERNPARGQEAALNAAKSGRRASEYAHTATSGTKMAWTAAKYATLGAAQLGLGVLQMRKMKERASVKWLKAVLEIPKDEKEQAKRAQQGSPTQRTGAEPYTTVHPPFWTQFDAQLDYWQCEYMCRTPNEKIQLHLDQEKAAEPPRGIMKQAGNDDAFGNYHVAQAYEGDEIDEREPGRVWAYCTVTPAEERKAVVERFEGLLTDIKTLLKDYWVNSEKIKEQGLSDMSLKDPKSWVHVPLKPLMLQLSPLVDEWLAEYERLIIGRFVRLTVRGYVERPITAEEHLELVLNDPTCKRCMTKDELKAQEEEVKQAKAAEARQQRQAETERNRQQRQVETDRNRQQRQAETERNRQQRQAETERARQERVDRQLAESGPRAQKLAAAEAAAKKEGYRVTKNKMREGGARMISLKALLQYVAVAVDDKVKRVYRETADDELEEEIPIRDLNRIVKSAKTRAEKVYNKFRSSPDELPERVEDADRILSESANAAAARAARAQAEFSNAAAARAARAQALRANQEDDLVDEDAEREAAATGLVPLRATGPEAAASGAPPARSARYYEEARAVGLAAGKERATELLDEDPTISDDALSKAVAQVASRAVIEYERLTNDEVAAIGNKAAADAREMKEAWADPDEDLASDDEGA